LAALRAHTIALLFEFVENNTRIIRGHPLLLGLISRPWFQGRAQSVHQLRVGFHVAHHLEGESESERGGMVGSVAVSGEGMIRCGEEQ
jgi:hypothetical protein